MINPLHIPARLFGAVVTTIIATADALSSEHAAFLALHIFTLQLEILTCAIAIRRPLENSIDDPGFGVTTKKRVDAITHRIQILIGPIGGAARQIRQAGTPAAALTNIVAKVGKYDT